MVIPLRESVLIHIIKIENNTTRAIRSSFFMQYGTHGRMPSIYHVVIKKNCVRHNNGYTIKNLNLNSIASFQTAVISVPSEF